MKSLQREKGASAMVRTRVDIMSFKMVKRKRAMKERVCCSCGKKGHATTRNKACINHISCGAPAVARAAPASAFVLTDADHAEDVANFETFRIDEEENNTIAALLLAMATPRDARIYDSDGENIYSSPPAPPPTTTTTTSSGPI
jgi:hypothetical protein